MVHHTKKGTKLRPYAKKVKGTFRYIITVPTQSAIKRTALPEWLSTRTNDGKKMPFLAGLSRLPFIEQEIFKKHG